MNPTRLLILLSGLALPGCAPTLPPPAAHPAHPVPTAEPRVSNISDAPAPAAGAMTRATFHEGTRTVTHVLRLAPGAEIPLHHHPFFDETFIVERGSLRMELNGRAHQLRAGDVVVIAAGTVITGRNVGAEEARVVVVFSNTGQPGPLTVPGHPKH